ncbi:hypothetical protein FA15DRAFT_669660 [Coprinopsis marcescibilis]|uniref:Uncharacterized protein n=1 Tax=Coprinopsis marcescibilis TaxID=230819 RepID=A0A5C3KUJ7_COPMA|nr:hypothetical protein FA15DRAFT_669660 [Coprinopsis marcescibilis]
MAQRKLLGRGSLEDKCVAAQGEGTSHSRPLSARIDPRFLRPHIDVGGSEEPCASTRHRLSTLRLKRSHLSIPPIAALRGKILCARCSLFKHSNHLGNPPLPKIYLSIPSATRSVPLPTDLRHIRSRKDSRPSTYRQARVFVIDSNHAFVNAALKLKLPLPLPLPYFSNVASMHILVQNIATFLDAIEPL